MKVRELIGASCFTLVNEGDVNKEIQIPFCCDLLSIAMSKAVSNSAWVTVMGNINTLAVASLTDAACVILAEGVQLDSPALEKAKVEGITVFCTEQPIFQAAQQIFQLLNE